MGGPTERRAQIGPKKMGPKIHEIATNPDTVIVLTRRLTNFAIWPTVKTPEPAEKRAASSEPTVSPAQAPASSPSLFGDGTVRPVSAQLSAIIASTPTSSKTDATGTLEGEQRDDQKSNSSKTGPPINANANVSGGSKSEQGKTTADNTDKIPDGLVHYHVSSQHLISASPYFKNMLSGQRWEEGMRKGDGRFYLTAEDMDERALEILLNVLHLKNRRVPRRISVEMLAKIAVLVDYYECREALEIFSTIWCLQTTADLSKIPKTVGRELMLWVCISYVFRMPDLFEHATTTVLKESKLRQLPTLDLPIAHILTAIDNARLRILSEASQRINTEFGRLSHSAYTCKFRINSSDACRYMLYGAVVAQTKDAGLLNGVLRDPDTTLSIEEVRQKVAGFKVPAWYAEGRAIHPCNLDDFKKSFEKVYAPELKSFMKSD